MRVCVNVSVTYDIIGDGVIKVTEEILPKDSLPDLPKVGMQTAIRRNYDNITWYGRGLLENYSDRKTGFFAGIYQLPIDKFMEPYVVHRKRERQQNRCTLDIVVRFYKKERINDCCRQFVEYEFVGLYRRKCQ
ncbi:MAG: hypothetical protein PW786_15830 [Arachidicoccus sp.]|nr:hypothetical protein [Arachidicoccus sp.]